MPCWSPNNGKGFAEVQIPFTQKPERHWALSEHRAPLGRFISVLDKTVQMPLGQRTEEEALCVQVPSPLQETEEWELLTHTPFLHCPEGHSASVVQDDEVEGDEGASDEALLITLDAKTLEFLDVTDEVMTEED